MYLRARADGSIESICTERRDENDIEVDLPEDFNWQLLPSYGYVDGKVVLIEQRRIAQENELRQLERAAHADALLQDRMRKAAAGEIAASGSADEIITVMSYLPMWTQDAYKIGDVVVYDGQPYRCVQAHNSAGNPGWTPAAFAAGWANYHGTTAETALPWVAPTGGHDMYKVGEMMVFTDGKVYRSLMDTAYSPDQYASAWEAVQ